MTRAPVEHEHALDRPLKAKVRRAVTTLGARAGMRVEKLEDDANFFPGHSKFTTDLQRKVVAVPGMISLRRAMYLYWLSLSGGPGDVVELGSWQGRSTVALAQGCEDSDNGTVHAVDWFQGNPGHEDHYGEIDSLEDAFKRNIEGAGLSHRVTLYAKGTDAAAPEVAAAVDGVRMIYIDADHTYDAVSRELRQYADLLSPGGMVTFDDYSKRFEGVAEAIHEHVAEHPGRYHQAIQDHNFLVLKRKF